MRAGKLIKQAPRPEATIASMLPSGLLGATPGGKCEDSCDWHRGADPPLFGSAKGKLASPRSCQFRTLKPYCNGKHDGAGSRAAGIYLQGGWLCFDRDFSRPSGKTHLHQVSGLRKGRGKRQWLAGTPQLAVIGWPTFLQSHVNILELF